MLDEADLWAPQRIGPNGLDLLGRVEEIVRRGRVRGFVPWLITQRPAVLHKNVLSQADVLVSMKLTSSQDRAAIGRWIDGQADRAEERRILAALPRLARGEAWVWAPSDGVLARMSFPRIRSPDSSATPPRLERAAASSPLAAPDPAALAAVLAAAGAGIEEEDDGPYPSGRRQVAGLQHRLQQREDELAAACARIAEMEADSVGARGSEAGAVPRGSLQGGTRFSTPRRTGFSGQGRNIHPLAHALTPTSVGNFGKWAGVSRLPATSPAPVRPPACSWKRPVCFRMEQAEIGDRVCGAQSRTTLDDSLDRLGLASATAGSYYAAWETQAMPRVDNVQLNIRSAYARDRVREMALGTGMTATEVVEDALRGYVPPATPEPVEGLVRRGSVLVKPAQGRHVTYDEADQALQAVRERDL